jgi:tetratricopeptide (TPR) repeat protein
MAEGGQYGSGISSLLEAAEDRRRAGRLLAARERFMEAAQSAEIAEDFDSFVKAALGAGGIWVAEQRDVVARATFETLLQRAQTLAAAGSLEETCLAVRHAAEGVYQGAPVEPVVEAVERVRSFGEDAATAEALSLLHHVQLGPRYAEVRLGMAEEIVRLGARANDPFLSLMGLCWRTVDLFLIGDPRAGHSLEELRERSAVESCDALGFIADVLAAMVLARAGRLDDAEAASASALERGTQVGDPDAPAYYGAMLAALRWWQGRGTEVIEVVRSISTSPRLGFNDHVYVAGDAALSAVLGDLDSAEEALARLVGLGLDRLPHSSSWLTTQFLVVEAAYLLGDAEVAASTRELLAPYAHLPVMPSLGVVCFGSVERSLGLCAATIGLPDAAVHHLDAAIRVDRRLGSRPMVALTERTLADVLRARGAENDEARAEQLARHAEERAERMAMVLPGPPSWLVAHEFASRMGARFREASFQTTLRGWRLVTSGRTTLLPHRVGLVYLAELLVRPGQDVEVLSLASQGLLSGGPSDAVADEEALDSYRRRVRELKAMIGRGNLKPSDSDRYQEELVALVSALKTSTGLGGRRRVFPDNEQRARTSVRKALIRGIDEIESVEPELGQHLRASVVTGITCRYSPTSAWKLTIQH